MAGVKNVCWLRLSVSSSKTRISSFELFALYVAKDCRAVYAANICGPPYFDSVEAARLDSGGVFNPKASGFSPMMAAAKKLGT